MKSKKKSKETDNIIIDSIKLKKNKIKKSEENSIIHFKSSIKDSLKNLSSIKDFNKSSNIRFTRKFNQLDDLCQLLQSSQNYKRALKLTQLTNFVDKDFPADIDSLVGYQQLTPSHFAFDLCWLRPKQFYSLLKKDNKVYYTPKTSENFIIYDQIRAADIEQGQLGDCYLLAACGSIAQFPHRLERIFISGNKYNPQGLYAIALCINGMWEEIILDDYFPCTKNSKRPAFSTSKNNTLWMMLLEKVWAKVHFGFFNIAKGFVGEALRDLTGAPTETYFTKDQDFSVNKSLNDKNNKNWNSLLEAFQKQYILCTSTKSHPSKGDSIDKEIGISWNHAYSILGVYDLGSDPDYKVLKLRNPWATGEWTKCWNAKDTRWTPELKDKLGHDEIGNGVFFISYAAIIKYFSCFQICYFHDKYKYSSLKVEKNQKSIFLSVRITTKGLYYFSLNQINKRFYPFDETYEYSEMNFILYHCNEKNHITYLNAQFKNKKESWIQENVKPGKYILEIRPNYKSFVKEFVVSVYGPSTSKILIEKPESFQKKNPNQFIIEAIERHISKVNIQFKTPFASKKFSYSLVDLRNGLGFIYFQNDELEYEIKVSVNMTKSENIEIVYPGNCFDTSLHLGSMQSKIIIFMANKLPYSVSTHFSFSCKKENKKFLNLDQPILKKKNKEIVKKPAKEEIKPNVVKLKNKDIVLTENRTEDNIFLVYENKSKTPYNIDITFNLINGLIEGHFGSRINFYLMSKETFFINIIRNDSKTEMKYQILRQDIIIVK